MIANNNYGYNNKIDSIHPIDVNHMFVSKYRNKGQPSGQQEYGDKKKSFHDKIQEEKEKIEYEEKNRERKEYSVQEHMRIMIWIGTKNINIMQN